MDFGRSRSIAVASAQVEFFREKLLGAVGRARLSVLLQQITGRDSRGEERGREGERGREEPIRTVSLGNYPLYPTGGRLEGVPNERP